MLREEPKTYLFQRKLIASFLFFDVNLSDSREFRKLNFHRRIKNYLMPFLNFKSEQYREFPNSLLNFSLQSALPQKSIRPSFFVVKTSIILMILSIQISLSFTPTAFAFFFILLRVDPIVNSNCPTFFLLPSYCCSTCTKWSVKMWCIPISGPRCSPNPQGLSSLRVSLLGDERQKVKEPWMAEVIRRFFFSLSLGRDLLSFITFQWF